MIAIVVSRADSASAHIGEQLLAEADWTEREDADRSDVEGGRTYYRTSGFELRTFDALHLELEDVAAAFDDPDLLVFVSRHSGDTGPLLTAHFTGNFGPAEFGGADRALARACPNAHSTVLDAFRIHAPEEYEVGAECTHHGPSTVGVPSMFVELGSDEPHWEDSKAAQAVARAVLDLRDVDADRKRQLVGFGGGHYAPRFERIVRETDWAVGHIAADWCLEDMGNPVENRDVISRTFEQSAASYAVFDGDHPELASVVDNLGYRVVSETWVRQVEDVPLSFADRVEEAVATVDDGLRFGAPAVGYDSAFVVVDLPQDVLDAARAIDREVTWDAVASQALAFETTENGNRVEGRAAVMERSDRDTIVDALVDVLRTEYDDVERTADAVVATERAFDPEKARTLGIEDGPEFGRLAAGEPVSKGDRTIEPAVVRTERKHRFSL